MSREDIVKRLEQYQERSKLIQDKLIRLDEQRNTIQAEITKIEEEIHKEVGDLSEKALKEKIDSFYIELNKLLDEADEACKGIE